MIHMTVGYIDPGSGAMLLQWLIASMMGAGFFLRGRIARLFRKLVKREPKAGPEAADKDKNPRA